MPFNEDPKELNPLKKMGFNTAGFRQREDLEYPYGREESRAVQNYLEYVPEYGDRTIGTEKILPRYRLHTGTALTLEKSHYIVACDTTSNAITITLPDATTCIGQEYIIYFAVDGGNNLTVNLASGDTFRGAAGAGNDSGLYEDAHDFVHLCAVMPNVWLVVSEVGGTYS